MCIELVDVDINMYIFMLSRFFNSLSTQGKTQTFLFYSLINKYCKTNFTNKTPFLIYVMELIKILIKLVEALVNDISDVTHFFGASNPSCVY